MNKIECDMIERLIDKTKSGEVIWKCLTEGEYSYYDNKAKATILISTNVNKFIAYPDSNPTFKQVEFSIRLDKFDYIHTGIIESMLNVVKDSAESNIDNFTNSLFS